MTGSKVVLICQWYPPEPVSQPVWIVDALKRSGLDVEVLTGVPNYPTGRVAAGYSARDRLTEEIGESVVHRTPLYPSHDANAVRRILNYLSWALSSALLGQRHLKHADVALVYSSPATAAASAMAARRLHGVPYVLLIQDVWPDSIFDSGFLVGRVGRFARRITSFFVDSAYRRAAHVVVISPGMAELLASRGVPRGKITVIPNWIGDEPVALTVDTDLRGELGLTTEDFVLMYAGNHGGAQALDAVVRGFAELAPDDACHLVMVGDGVEKPGLQALAQDLCPDRVHFLDPQPRSAMTGLMAQADAQLVSLARRPLFAITTPSKLQSALAAGHPVLVSADGDAAATVRAADAGLAVPPENPSALANAVRQFEAMSPEARRQLGRNGRSYYESTMAEPVGAARLASVLANSCVGAQPREGITSK